MISRKTKYGLQALLLLGREYGQGPILIADLSAQGKIPRKFLETILLQLKNAGVLHSRKGKGGGYSLARSPAEISIGQVVKILDGTIAPLECVNEEVAQPCPESLDCNSCGLRLVMKDAGDAMTGILDHTSLQDMQNRSVEVTRKLQGIVDYQI